MSLGGRHRAFQAHHLQQGDPHGVGQRTHGPCIGHLLQIPVPQAGRGPLSRRTGLLRRRLGLSRRGTGLLRRGTGLLRRGTGLLRRRTGPVRPRFVCRHVSTLISR
jgi:hypothetical protein